MAEENKIQLEAVLDPSTVTKNLSISTQYVTLLQNSLLFVLGQVDPADIPTIYTKIDNLIEGDTSIKLNQMESTVFTLTSLIQYIRGEAFKQDNILKDLKPKPVSKESATAVFKELLNNGTDDFNPDAFKKASDKLMSEAFPPNED